MARRELYLSEAREDSCEIIRPYSASEVLAYLADFGVRAGRGIPAAELMMIMQDKKTDELSNFLDPYRDKIIAWALKNWDNVKYYAEDCPLAQDKRACYTCSDGLVTACYMINKDQIDPQESEEESEDD